MISYTSRKKSTGEKYITATVRLRKDGAVVFSKSQSFDSQLAARAWAEPLDISLAQPGGAQIVKANAGDDAQRTLAAAIHRYIREYDTTTKRFGRSKRKALLALTRTKLGAMPVADITDGDIVQHIKERRAHVEAATAMHDIQWIKTALEIARIDFRWRADERAATDARKLLSKRDLIGPGVERERRPTDDELIALRTYFRNQGEQAELPMTDLMDFAIASTRRQGEIPQLLWADLDRAHQTILVRGASGLGIKHPKASQKAVRPARLTDEAMAIIERQPKTNDFIFPYNPKSIYAAFHSACLTLGICLPEDDPRVVSGRHVNLTWHDLRHEGVSRLFEAGYPIAEAQQFTLHKSWKQLQRYANLKAKDVKLRPSLKIVRS